MTLTVYYLKYKKWGGYTLVERNGKLTWNYDYIGPPSVPVTGPIHLTTDTPYLHRTDVTGEQAQEVLYTLTGDRIELPEAALDRLMEMKHDGLL